MSHVEQLEQETERTRSEIADTLDELRASMTPGRIVDQLTDRLSDGAPAAFARNLKHQTVNNPLPVALIGAGLAWLMLSPRDSGRSISRGAGERLRGAGEAANDAAETIGSAADSASRAASERATRAGAATVGTIQDAAGSMTDAVQGGAAQTADTVRETFGAAAQATQDNAARAADAMRETAGAISGSVQRTASTVTSSARVAGRRTLQSGNAFVDFCREQPMVLAGLGLALGAVVGALLPATETENQLVGESSDRVKERAGDLAAEQYETAKQVGEHAFEAAKDEAIKQTNEQDNAGDPHKDGQGAAGEVKAEGATLVPSRESELETRGQPWTAENAPI